MGNFCALIFYASLLSKENKILIAYENNSFKFKLVIKKDRERKKH